MKTTPIPTFPLMGKEVFFSLGRIFFPSPSGGGIGWGWFESRNELCVLGY